MKATPTRVKTTAMAIRMLIAGIFSMALTMPLFAQEPASDAVEESEAKDAIAHSNAQQVLVREAAQLASQGNTEAALVQVDEALADYTSRFSGEQGRVYSIRDGAEALLYMAMAANDGQQATAVEFEYGFAWYLRGYLLVEQQRLDEALGSLEKAAELSPMNSQYLSEAAHIHQGRKDWARALDLYERAEGYSAFSGDQAQQHKARALRGQGFVLVRMGRLDEAEKAYREALAIDPADARAKDGLNAVDELRDGKQTSG